MAKTVSHPEAIITRFREMPPAKSATAHAIGRHEPWERMAQNAGDDDSVEFDDELVRFIGAYVRRGA